MQAPHHHHVDPIGDPPTTHWGRVITAEVGEALHCAACGVDEHVVPAPGCADIPFCIQCTDHTRDLTDWDDIGTGD